MSQHQHISKKLFKKEHARGYAILEILFYISFFVILSIVVIEAMITMSRSFRATSIEADFVESAGVMERITREIRGAEGISSISTSTLLLNTTNEAGAPRTVQFALSGSNVTLTEDGALTGNLNTPSVAVTALTFTQINTAEGAGVKVVLSLRSVNDSSGRVETFYDTVVLRGNY